MKSSIKYCCKLVITDKTGETIANVDFNSYIPRKRANQIIHAFQLITPPISLLGYLYVSSMGFQSFNEMKKICVIKSKSIL